MTTTRAPRSAAIAAASDPDTAPPTIPMTWLNESLIAASSA